MKTLILFGSPSSRGHTMAMVEMLRASLEGDVQLVDAYRAKISPCVDCRHCSTHPGCSIDDDMQGIYTHIAGSDNIVIASPMHFGIVSAPLVTLFSRLQTYWSARHIRREEPPAPKQGALLAATGTSWPNMRHVIEGVTDIAFTHMGVESVGSVFAMRTDRVPARENRECVRKVKELALRLNRGESF